VKDDLCEQIQLLADALKGKVKDLEDAKLNRHDEVMMWVEKCNQAETRLNKLVEAVEKHRDNRGIEMEYYNNLNLYKVLEEVK
jgi:hypothetical protein